MEADITSQAAGLAGATDFSILSLFLRADLIVKSVIIILIACSIYSWAIIFDKIFMFRRINKESEDFEVEESEDTMSILERYIEESETELDKAFIKSLVRLFPLFSSRKYPELIKENSSARNRPIKDFPAER